MQDLLLYVSDYWRKAIDGGNFVGAVFLDLRKAFDCVNHGIWLDKLSVYCHCEITFAWFKDYLSNRQQRVKMSDSVSDWREVTIGVPQGSVLGLLLFSVFINDLPRIVPPDFADIALFADDTTVYSTAKSTAELTDKLQKSIDLISNWLAINRISLNASKLKLMLFSSGRRKIEESAFKIEVAGKVLTTVDTHKYLRVIHLIND